MAKKIIMDHIIGFGAAGVEIMSGKPHGQVAPVKSEPDIREGREGKVLSIYALNAECTGLSQEGLEDYRYFRGKYDKFIDRYGADRDGALAYIIGRLSSESVLTMDTKSGPEGYEASKRAKNVLRVWELIEETHLTGSSRSKHGNVVALFGLRQTGPHESFMSDFLRLGALLEHDYGSKEHPGFISIKALLKALYILGVDQVFFARFIDRELEEPDGDMTLLQLMERFQQYAFEKGGVASQKSTAYVGQALVASTTGDSGASSLRGSLGPYVAGSKLCKHCWDAGYRRDHDMLTDCHHYRKHQKWKKEKASRAAPAGVPLLQALVAASPAETEQERGKRMIAEFEKQIPLYRDNVAKYSSDMYPGAQKALMDGAVDRLSALCLQSHGSSTVPPAGSTLPPGTPLLSSSSVVAVTSQQSALVAPAAFGAASAPGAPSGVGFFSARFVAPVTMSAFLTAAEMADIAQFWYDNCASCSLVMCLAYLVEVVLLDEPFRVGGAELTPGGSGFLVTHAGYLPFLPRDIAVAYFSAECNVNLVSLGSIQALGGGYCSRGRDELEVYGTDGVIFDVARLAANRLPGVSKSVIASASFTAPVALPVAFPAPLHINAEQRERIDRVEVLHQGRAAHCSDDALAEALSLGEFSYANLTPADVRLNRLHRGPCPQCIEGKMKRKPMPTSNTPPAEAVGDVIYCDIYSMLSMTPGGKIIALRTKDEWSGYEQITTGHSKRAPDLYKLFMEVVVENYNKYGHRVKHFVLDAEPAAAPVVAMLSAHGITLTFVDPGQFSQRMENAVASTGACKLAVLASLPWHLPKKYDVFAIKWVADCRNGIQNSRSRPSTPDILVTGKRRSLHYKHPELSFGASCMVQQHDDKRQSIANVSSVTMKNVSKAELGVLLGFDANVPGDYLFLLANGQIVPRRVEVVVQVSPYSGFGGPDNLWSPKAVLHAQLASQAVFPATPDGVSLHEVDQSVILQPSQVPPREMLLGGERYVPSVLSPLDGSGVASEKSSENLLSVAPVVVQSDRDRDVIHDILFSSGASSASASSQIVNDLPFSDASSQPSILSPVRPARVVAPLVPRQKSDRLKGVHSYATSGDWGQGSYWKGSVVDDGKAHIASACFECVPSSGDYEAFICSACSDAGWSTVKHRSFHSVASAPASVVSHSQLAALFASPMVAPTIVLKPRSSRPKIQPDVQAFRDMLEFDSGWSLVEDAIVANAAALLAVETASFDTQRSDELSIDEIVALSTDIEAAAAEVAAVRPEALAAFCAWAEPSARAFVVASDLAPTSTLQPTPSTKCKEVSITKALRSVPIERLRACSKIEIDKQQRLGCLGTVSYAGISSLPAGCTVNNTVRGHALFKLKADDRETLRLAAMGNALPLDPTVSHYASVTGEGDKMFGLAMMQAHSEATGIPLNLSAFDVVGGFLHIKRTSTLRLFLLIPHNLPHPLAGLYVEILGALYGLRESNQLFAAEITRVCRSAGFLPTASSPMTFVCTDLVDPRLKSVASVHVDDIFPMDTCAALTARLIDALEARFGPMTRSPSATLFVGVFAGYEIAQQPNGAVLSTQDKYISRVASVVGVTNRPSVDVPSTLDFFQRSEPSESALVDVNTYQSLTGHLVQMLKTRDEVRPFVSHCCSRNSTPDEGDYRKALRVLEYLHSTPGIGRVYKAASPVICAHADAAFGSREGGTSAGAFFLSVGLAGAPFHSYAKAQVDVATCPMTAEYYSASNSCKAIMHYRQFAQDLGFQQRNSTALFVDNETARKLAVSPEVSKKSKHISVAYHYIRQLVARNSVRLELVSSLNMRADILTKILPRASFRRQRALLLNLDALSGTRSSGE